MRGHVRWTVEHILVRDTGRLGYCKSKGGLEFRADTHGGHGDLALDTGAVLFELHCSILAWRLGCSPRGMMLSNMFITRCRTHLALAPWKGFSSVNATYAGPRASSPSTRICHSSVTPIMIHLPPSVFTRVILRWTQLPIQVLVSYGHDCTNTHSSKMSGSFPELRPDSS